MRSGIAPERLLQFRREWGWGIGRAMGAGRLLRRGFSGQIQIFTLLENAPVEQRAVAGPYSLHRLVPLDQGSHAFHLRVEVVQLMQKHRLRKQRSLRGAELQLTVMANDHVAKEVEQRRGKSGNQARLLIDDLQPDDYVA